MADHVQLPLFVGSAVFATDDISSVHYPRGKVVWGVDGTATDASHTAPLPVVEVSSVAAPFKADGSGRVTIEEISVNATADGDNALRAAPGAGVSIRVCSYLLNATGAGQFELKSGSTIKGRVRSASDADGAVFRGSAKADECAFTCAANTALNLNCPVGVDMVGHMVIALIS